MLHLLNLGRAWTLASRMRFAAPLLALGLLPGCGEDASTVEDEDSDDPSKDGALPTLSELPSEQPQSPEPSEKTKNTKQGPKPKNPEGGSGGDPEPEEPKEPKEPEEPEESDKSKEPEGGGGNGDEVPKDVDYCDDVVKWDPAWSKLEDEIVDIVNEVRAKGADCGLSGKFDAAPPVKAQPNLRCAARVHSKDMAEKGYFEHVNKEGESPFVRMEKAGYKGGTAGENIAAGGTTAEGTMKQWLDSDGHCSNLMNPRFKYLGVGYYPKADSPYRHYWTQNFGG